MFCMTWRRDFCQKLSYTLRVLPRSHVRVPLRLPSLVLRGSLAVPLLVLRVHRTGGKRSWAALVFLLLLPGHCFLKLKGTYLYAAR